MQEIGHHEFGFFAIFALIVPKETLHHGEGQGTIEPESLLQFGISGTEIALVDAVEDENAVGRAHQSSAFDAEFGERKLDNSIAAHAQRAADAFVGLGQVDIGRNLGYHRQRFVGAISVTTAQ